jgi:hypothetical protein
VRECLPPVLPEPVPATVCQPVTSDDILLREGQTEDVLFNWFLISRRNQNGQRIISVKQEEIETPLLHAAEGSSIPR